MVVKDQNPVAVVTVPISGAPTPGVTGISASVSFYQDPQSTNILHFEDPLHSEFNSSLVPDQWVSAGSWFFWDDKTAKAIIWGYYNGDWDESPKVPLTIPPNTPSSVVATSTAATAAPSSASPVPGSSESPPVVSSTATPVTSPSASPPAKTISNGSVAGVAIGCLIVGALIAGFLAWFFLGRSRKQQRARDQEASVTLVHGEKVTPTKAFSIESGSPISQALEHALPQPLEDKAISGEISKISNAVKNHVQSFYHSNRISPGLLGLDDLQALGDDLPISTGTLSTLLGNLETREIALRFCIAWVMVSRIQLHQPPTTTFLPPEIASCFQSMAFVDRGSQVQALFLAKWRAITANLMQSTYVRNSFSASDARSHNIKAALDVLDSILQPYADSRIDNNQRRRNLEEILKRAATFAFTLFAQPSSWNFDWQSEQSVKSGSLCVFPALMQVRDENGGPVRPPRPFSEAVVRRLDG